MSIFKGAATALITPFIDDKVDFKSLETLVDRQLENGIDALIINGTTGEPTTMTHFERTAVAGAVIEHVKKRVPVILGAGSNNTYTAIEYAKENEQLGADAILTVTPYYNKCTQSGLVAHYKAIADAVDLPVIMYNVPGRTGVNIAPETCLKLAGYRGISAIKEASGNINQYMALNRLIDGKMDIYSGDDGLVYPLLALGAKGVISVASNVAPQYMHDMVYKFFEGDWKTSLEMQQKIEPLVKALFAEVNPIPVKCALKLMGIIPDDYMRLPLTRSEKVDEMRKALNDFGIQTEA
ncbi:MAG TPA: 4-hydroxy-tetrahydrodipicolinate synthase [Candidatus Stercoripulliclostridium merdigallinarum]|uniref:4-hydroxy-tetrahydrodipicolinate synthase n=1 Tax=Candidatus Stercoripulliclostridium merdigallinarum TaxID=2840951 RepID=A0A9D1MIG6_9FIRM|nr:4-hydroxy-tetrahydrodipicolinate synthase [Candidatus Stercoripulliclostridium merdigallinarum]